MKICGLVLTFNESHNIAACLESLRPVCDELLVIDSNSTDDTLAIVRNSDSRVIVTPFKGHGPQRNFGAQNTHCDWILSLDADERLTSDAARAINELKNVNPTGERAYAFNRKNYIGRRWIKHSGWSPDWVARLYNKKFYRFSDDHAHQHLEAPKSQIYRLDGFIDHFSYSDYAHLLQKANWFSTTTSNELLAKGRAIKAYDPALHGLAGFMKKFFFQRGFCNGIDGFTLAICRGINSYFKYAKAYEKQNLSSSSKDLERDD